MPLLSIADLASALHAIGRLLRLDPRGFDWFDTSADGVLKSFWVAIFLLPLYLLHVVLDMVLPDGMGAGQPLRYLSVEVIAYVVDWVAFPLLMLTVGPALLGSGRRIHRYVVALNWMQMPLGLVILPLGIVARLGVMPSGASSLFGLMAVAGSLVVAGAVARAGLEVSWWTAVGVTVLGFTLSLFINGLAFSMIASGL